MFLLSGFLVCSAVVAHIDDGVWAEMPPPAVSMKDLTHHFRSLEKEDFQKTSPNNFDLNPNCEQLGARYCDYSAHNLGSGLEFASWAERTQFVYTNMARTDFAAFAKAPYSAKYACTTKSGLVPFYWSSELTQAARFHSNEMATLGHFGHDTPSQNADLFGNSADTGARIKYFMTSSYRGWGENIAAGRGTPLAVTKQWLDSAGHCSQMFGSLTFMGVGYAYLSSSPYSHYWSENFWKGPTLPIQDIVAGTHDTITGTTNRFLVQVHMSQAPNKVSVVVGGTTKTMALLLGNAKSGTYFVDIASLSGSDTDGCVPYYFEVNSGASRMPADTSYHFWTYGTNNCKRNIGKGNTQPQANQCICPNGIPKTGTTCTSNGASMCASCGSGYTINSQNTVCTAVAVSTNQCLCPNGTPKTGTACTSNGASMCASCKAEFTINAQKTACTVEGGGALPTCSAVAAKSKGKCETCFHSSQCIDGYFCCPFMRKCVASSSMGCSYPIGNCNPRCYDSKCKLGEGCTDCDGCTGLSTYTWLEWANLAGQGKVKTCTSKSAPPTNVCTCPNGIPKTGTACTSNGASMCASCGSGYTINSQNTGCTTSVSDGVSDGVVQAGLLTIVIGVCAGLHALLLQQ